MSYTEQDIHTALTRELTDERVATAAAYWLDASPHERWVPDGIILARYARHAMAEIERLKYGGWISVKERLPETRQRVIVCLRTYNGGSFIAVAEYIAPRTVPQDDYISDDFLDFYDYDEENDVYWTPAGFYEWCYESENTWHLGEKVTHWMPIPEPPKEVRQE